MKIAYVSYKIQEKYMVGITEDEDSLLLNFLLQKGLDVTRVIWNDTSVDWKVYNLAVLKSPWDYHENIIAFYSWLDRIQKFGVKLLNPYDIIRWNCDKHYLQDIADSGLNVIPSIYLEKGEKPDLAGLFKDLNAEKLIVKPCVSAGAKNTTVLTKENMPVIEEQVNTLLQNESLLVQPFMEEIHNGEWSFIFFNGKYSHSLLKMPKTGDFRVQHYHGGSILPKASEAAYINDASAFVKQFAKDCLYARVDGILSGGALHLMELELIEPYLFLNTHTASFENYYSALHSFIDKKI